MPRPTPKSTSSPTKRKKVIAAINKILDEHYDGQFKVHELRLVPRGQPALPSSAAALASHDCPCSDDERKIEIHTPDGRLKCICVPN